MIYLDHHAATPLGDPARRAMDEARAEAWANPSSIHGAGRRARALVQRARRQVAQAIGAEPGDVVFTSGGTEACNLGIAGLCDGQAPGHVVTTEVEHPAVQRALARLSNAGWQSTPLPVLAGRPPSLRALRDALRDDSKLVAIQWVNHETGSVFPLSEYAALCRAHGAALFVDATQALGKLPVSVGEAGATAMAFASHKLGGPAGAGALWVERGRDLAPQLVGGAQEHGRRAGTPGVLELVGFGAACLELGQRLRRMEQIAALRERVEQALIERGGRPNGRDAPRVATVTNASFTARSGPALVAALDLEGLAVSSGAACSSGLDEPSPVLRAMYPDAPQRARSALRFSLGPETTAGEIDQAIQALDRVLSRPPA